MTALPTVERDIYAYKVFRLVFPNWFDNSIRKCEDCRAKWLSEESYFAFAQSINYPVRTGDDIPNAHLTFLEDVDNGVVGAHPDVRVAWHNIPAKLCKYCTHKIFTLETEGVLTPLYWNSYTYHLYDWNDWRVDYLGNSPYKDKPRDTMIPPTLVTKAQGLVEAIVRGRSDITDEQRKAIEADAWNVVVSEHFAANQFAGFHTHRSPTDCVVENYTSWPFIENITALTTLVGRVMLKGEVVSATNGFIGEKMQIVGLYSPLSEKIRDSWCHALSYPFIGHYSTIPGYYELPEEEFFAAKKKRPVEVEAPEDTDRKKMMRELLRQINS